MSSQKKYIRTHPWLTFRLDLANAPIEMWLKLGEACSKCSHIAGVPLKPIIAKKLSGVYLVKGIQATTAIEGNTLTEDEILDRIENRSTLPASREYLGVEVDNILSALKKVWAAAESGSWKLSTGEILDWNAEILRNVPREKPAIAGQIRQHAVGVQKYLGAPAEDCGYLLERLCDWLNEPWRPKVLDRTAAGILKAIVAHVYVAWIHPFGDGNGRTARLLEFKILTNAGVPDVAAHILTNHYNRTRQEYYRQLDNSWKSGGDLRSFFIYALGGFIDGLKDQLQVVRKQQLDLAWRDFVHERLPDGGGKVSMRQRHLLIALSKNGPQSIPDLRRNDARVAMDYQSLSTMTVRRDAEKLVSDGLLIRHPGEYGDLYQANMDLVLAFQPAKILEHDDEQQSLF